MKAAAQTRRHTGGAVVGSAVFVLAGLGVILAIGLAWYSLDPVQQQRRTEQARLELVAAQLAQQQQARALERQQQIDQALAPVDQALALFWRILPAGVVLGVVTLGAWYAVDRYRLARRLVWADARGVLPMPRLAVEQTSSAALATLAAHHNTQLAAASRPVLPESLHYAPKISNSPAAPALLADDAPPAPAQLAAIVPSFRDLLNRGDIARGAPLILGVSGGELLRGDWRKLYTCAVAGLGGTGKSTTVRFAACQAVLHGARFVVLDRHMDGGEDESLAQTLAPLHRHMLCAPAADDQDVLQALALVKSIGDARKSGKDKDRSPILLCVDEFTSYMSRSSVADPLAQLLEEIAQELRKFGVFGMIAGHVWTASRSGGSELRASLASAYVHRIRPDQARYLLGVSRQDVPDLLRLPTGSAYLSTTSGELQMVQIPNTTAADVQYVADLLDQPSPAPDPEGGRYLDMLRAPAAPAASFASVAPAPMLESAPAPVPEIAPTQPVTSAGHQDAAKPLDAKTLRVVALLAQETPHEQIIREVWQVQGKGNDYKSASRELRGIVASLAQRIQL